MKLLIKIAVVGTLAIASLSAQAYDCVPGGTGHCIWGIDKDNPKRTDLIDSTLFVDFCAKNAVICPAYDNGYHAMVGRYMDDEVFMIATHGWGGPDLIFDSLAQAEQFVSEFKKVSLHPDARFYIKDAPGELLPTPRIASVAYKVVADNGAEEIKLRFLPNELDETGVGYVYIPSDM